MQTDAVRSPCSASTQSEPQNERAGPVVVRHAVDTPHRAGTGSSNVQWIETETKCVSWSAANPHNHSCTGSTSKLNAI